MKTKLLRFCLTALMLLVTTVCHAYQACIDGIYYNFSGSNATVTYLYNQSSSNNTAYTGNIVIPSTVDYNGKTYSVTTIEDCAFYCCNSLTSVRIPESVTAIGRSAFSYCSSLAYVSIPETVTTIGNDAFLDCSSLTSVNITNLEAWCKISFDEYSSNPLHYAHHLFLKGEEVIELVIPESVTTIGDFAFRKCTSLASVRIPESVTAIGRSAFSECSSLASVSIPETVTTIGDYAFNYCTSLTSVTIPESVSIPESVTTIGDYAFNYCTSLASVRIPESVTAIGRSAFSYCSSLTSVRIPESVTAIGRSAFSYCSSLTSVTIPKSVTTIGAGTFAACTSLTSVSIPDGVTNIGESAFSGCTGLTNITIPNSVTSIENYAFYSCSGIKCITFEDGASPIKFEDLTFYNCPLTKLYWGRTFEKNSTTFARNETLCDVTIGNGVTDIAEEAFYECPRIISINLPENLKSIGRLAFAGCNDLYRVVNYSNLNIQKGSEAYGRVAYYAQIVINVNDAGNTHTGDFVFNTDANGNNYLEAYAGNAAVPILPDSYQGGVYYIGAYAFAGCNSLRSITIPSNVTSIGEKAFYGCNLRSVTVGEKVTSIGSQAFTNVAKVIWLCNTPPTGSYNCYGMVSYASNNQLSSNVYPLLSSSFIVDGVKYAIVDAKNRTCVAIDCTYDGSIVPEVKIGPKVTYKKIEMDVLAVGPCVLYKNPDIISCVIDVPGAIGNNAIQGCENLKSVEISAESLGYYTLADCNNLSSLTLHSGISSLNYGCCNGTTSLQEVVIPATVMSIGDIAFANNRSLKRFVIEDGQDNLQLGGGVLSKSNIKSIYIGRKLTYSGTSPFYNNTSLQTVEFNDNEDTIYDKEFSGCTNLTYVTLSHNTTSIGAYAFEGCKSLSTLTIPEETLTIGEYAFKDATGLHELVIPKNVESIGDRAFYDVSSLSRLIIADSEKTLNLGKNLFYGAAVSDLYIGRKLAYSKTSQDNYSPFYNNKKLENLEINGFEDTIFDYEFSGCTSLQNVVVGNRVTAIGANAFEKCAAITNISLGNKVRTLGNYTFSGCSSLRTIKIPESTVSLGSYVFSGASELTDFTLPAATTSVGEYAFKDCSNLTSFNFVDSESTVRLSQYVFENCPLEEVYIGRKLSYPTSYGSGISPFYGMTTLSTVKITDLEDTIYDNEFWGCYNLSTVNIGNGVTSIGKWAFSGCASLNEFRFGYSLKTIGQEAFSDCTALTALYSMALIPPVCGQQALEDISKWDCTLYVPEKSIDAYTEADQWQDFFFCEINEDYIPPIVPGDVNVDDKFDIADVDATVNVLLVTNTEGLDVRNANVNGDADTTIGDLCLIIDALQNLVISVPKMVIAPSESMQLSVKTTKPVTWICSDEDIAKVNSSGIVKAITEGEVTITAVDEHGLSAKTTIKIVDPHEYVDLGLPSGTLWATCNVGANSPEESGYKFAWGETYNKTEFTGTNYAYGAYSNLSKYVTTSYSGRVDNKTKLDLTDDAAYVQWGSNWCMPTKEQAEELLNKEYTTTTWTTLNNVNGCLITSKKNNTSLFIPSAMSDSMYWTNSLYTGNMYSSGSAWYMKIGSGTGDKGRANGMPVRAVRRVK